MAVARLAALLFFIAVLASSDAFTSMTTRGARRGVSKLSMALNEDELAQVSRDLTGYKLSLKFDGFGGIGLVGGMELEDGFKVKFSQGIESIEPGFWRVVKYEDGRECIEATQPVTPEYMFFFDIWEPSILWRGELDFDTMRVVKGEVVTNKKRFGIFPTTETLATFEADVLTPGERLPKMILPQLKDQQFFPPVDFVSPLDMERFPNIFSNAYRRWWFSVEDALGKGASPPARPQPFFVPDGQGEEGDALDGVSKQAVSRVREGKAFSRRDNKNGKNRGKGF